MSAILAVFASRLYEIHKDPVPLFLSLSYADFNHVLRNRKWPDMFMFKRILKGIKQLNNEELAISIVSEEETK